MHQQTALLRVWLAVAFALGACSDTAVSPVTDLSVQTNGSATFRSDTRRTGVYAAPGVPNLTGVAWSFQAEGRIFSSPAIAESKLFVGSEGGSLYALDGETGDQLWRFETPWDIDSSPAVARGLVFVGSASDALHALNAS